MASDLSRIPELDFIDPSHVRFRHSDEFFLERKAPFDLAAELATAPPRPNLALPALHSLRTPSGCL